MENLLAVVLARAGNIDSARVLIAHWPGRTDNYMAMAALVAVGDTATALDRFERAQPDPSYWAYLHRPEFDALHGNPRYGAAFGGAAANWSGGAMNRTLVTSNSLPATTTPQSSSRARERSQESATS